MNKVNVLPMLTNQISLSTGEEGANLLNGQNIPQYEQPFNQVLAQLVDPSNVNLSVYGEGQEHPALTFQVQLLQLLSLVDELDNETSSFMPSTTLTIGSALSEGEDDSGVLGELIQYLENFVQEMEEGNLSVEELYSLFVAIPQLPTETSLSMDESQAKSLGYALTSEGQADRQHWNRWSMLFEQTQQLMQDKSVNKEMQQVARMILSVMNQWNEHPEWLAMLQQKIGQKLTNLDTSLTYSQSKQEQPVFLSLPPLSLLNQVKENNNLERTSTAHQLTINGVANHETQGAIKQVQQLSFASEIKEMVLEGTDRLVTPSKSSESTPLPSARLTHLFEDMQAILRKQISILKDGELTQLRVRLKPEHLGHLDIRIISENGKVTAQIMTSTKLAKEVLELQLYQLRATLTQQGIQIERMEVSQQTTNSHNLLEQEQRNAKHFQQQKEKQTNQQVNYVDTEEPELNESSLYDQVSQINYAV